MKRLYLLIVFTTIMVQLNAERTYNFAGITADKLKTNAFGTSYYDEYSMASVVDYLDPNDTMEVKIIGMDDFIINYRSSSGKQHILRFKEDYMVFDGKNGILTFQNVPYGSEISLLVSAKGASAPIFTAIRGATGKDQILEGITVSEDYVIVTFTAISSIVQIQEISGGFRIKSAVVHDGVCGDNLKWNLTDEVLTIYGSGKMYDYNDAMSIPWYNDRSTIKRVIIKDGITNIGNNAFYGCNNLQEMTILATVPPILGNNAFYSVPTGIPVYVPCESLSFYTTLSGWRSFTNYINIYQYGIELEVSDPVMGETNLLQRSDCETVTIQAIPNDGYYFLRWSNGSTENPYTLTLTQDTLLKAEFYEIGTNGQLGDNLYWELQDKNLFITGSGPMYNYNETTVPFLHLAGDIRSVSFPADITTIGDYAFYGCKNITSINIPQNVTTIGEYSFAECSLLSSVTIGAGVTSIGCNAFLNDWSIEEIYCYPYNAPTVCETAFNGIIKNYVYLYVQGDRVRHYQLNPYFTDFDIRAIGAETVPSDDDVVVIPSDRDAQFTWPANGNASSYTLQITKDGEVFCTLVFNEYGQLTGIAFAPARNGEQHPRQAATATTNGWQFTVTGLNEGSAYAYTLDVKDAANNVLNSYNGTFQTTGAPTSIDTPDEIGGSLTPHARKVIENGNVYILLPDGRKLNLQGAEVK